MFDHKDDFEESIPAKGLSHITMPGGNIRKFNGDHIIYTEVHMFFIFLMTSAAGGFLIGRGLADGDGGSAFLGFMIAIISWIALGYVGFPA